MAPPAATKSNELVSARGQRVVVSGATQGIGLGVALRFAQAGAEVWIVGRNPTTAAPQFRFFQADFTSIAQTERAAREIAAAAGERGVDHLIQTQGGPAYSSEIAPLADGFDAHFAVAVVSRFVLAYHLTVVRPIVKGSVTAIGHAGAGSKNFDESDVTLEKAKKMGKYSMYQAMTRDCTAMDSLWQELAQRVPTVRFLHLSPGAVRTNGVNDPRLPRLISILSKVFLAVIGVSTEDYANVPFFLVANPEGQKLVGTEPNATHWNHNLKRIAASPASQREEVRKAVWDLLTSKLST